MVRANRSPSATNDQLLSSQGYNGVIVAYRNGAPVRLSDVATAIDGAENVKQAAWVEHEARGSAQYPAPARGQHHQRGDRIKKVLPQLQASMPAAVKAQILIDRTQTIRASVDDVQFELMLTVALVVMVIFLFLRNLAATVIPSVAVPLSLVGTFGVMYLLGYSLNNLTLMALTISTGFVVDDAIVMIENIDRYLEEGDSPLDAALKGAGQIGFTIVSLTVSLIAVLIPLLFMGDIVGRLFREFAVTLAVTILVSAAVSLTLTPMMCAKLLKQRQPGKESRFFRVTEDLFNRVIAFYGRTFEVRSEVSDHHSSDHRIDFNRYPAALCVRAQGFLSGAGYGCDHGDLGSGGEHVVCRHVGAAAGAGESDSEESERRQPGFLHRSRWNQRYTEQRAHPDQSEAAQSAERDCVGNHPRPAAGVGHGGRHHALYAAGAGLNRGKPSQPDAIPVFDGRRGFSRIGDLGRGNFCKSCKAFRSCATWPATN